MNLDEMYADLEEADAAGETELASQIAAKIQQQEVSLTARAEDKKALKVPEAVGRFGDTLVDVTDETWEKGKAGLKKAWAEQDPKAAQLQTPANALIGALSGIPAGAVHMADTVGALGAAAVEGTMQGGEYTKAYEEAAKRRPLANFIGMDEKMKTMTEALPGSQAGLDMVSAPFAGLSEAVGEAGGPIAQGVTDVAMGVGMLPGMRAPKGAAAARNLPKGTPERPVTPPAVDQTAKSADELIGESILNRGKKPQEGTLKAPEGEQQLLQLSTELPDAARQQDLFSMPGTPKPMETAIRPDADMPARAIEREQATRAAEQARAEAKKAQEDKMWAEREEERKRMVDTSEDPPVSPEQLGDTPFEESRKTAMEQAWTDAITKAAEAAVATDRFVPESVMKKQGGWVGDRNKQTRTRGEKERPEKNVFYPAQMDPDQVSRVQFILDKIAEKVPHFSSLVDEYSVLSFNEILQARKDMIRLSKQGSVPAHAVNRVLANKYPDIEAAISKSKSLTWEDLIGNPKDSAPLSKTSAASHHGWERNGERGSSVLLNADALNHMDGLIYEPIHSTAATILHEVTHAFDWQRARKFDHAADEKKPYYQQTMEIRARNMEETAYQRAQKWFWKEIARDERTQLVDDARKGSAYPLDHPGAVRNSMAVELGVHPSMKKQRGSIDANLANYKKMFEGWKLWYSKDGKGTALTEHLHAIPDESTPDFIQRMGEAPEGDIRNQMGAFPTIYRTTNSLIGDYTNVAKNTALHFLKKAQGLLMENHRENGIMEAKFNPLYQEYGLNRVFRKGQDLDGLRKDVDTLLWFEQNSNQWFVPGGRYHPDAQMLIAKGMKPERAKMWQEYMETWDAGYDSMVTAAKMAGRHVPPKVPGWLPHTWHGPYAAVAYLLDEKGNKVGAIWEQNRRNSKDRDVDMKNMIDQVQKNGWQDKVVIERLDPTGIGNELGPLLSALSRAGDRMKNQKGFEALIKSFEEAAAKGLISSALERTNLNKAGHELARLADKNSVFGLPDNQVRDAFLNLRKNVEALNDWKYRVRLATETLFPLESAGFLDHPNLRKTIYDYLTSFADSRNPIAGPIDAKVRDFFIGKGKDPGMTSYLSGQMNNGLSKYYLMGNIAFYIVNIAQPILALPVLQIKRAEAMLVGDRTASITKALVRHTKNLKDGLGMNPDILWAKERGLLNAVNIEAMDTAQFKDVLSMKIESRMREQAFALSVEYYKQILPVDKARTAAVQAMKEMMVDYSSQLGAPTGLTNLPIAGRPLWLFAAFGQHMLSMYNQHAQIMKASVKAKNVPAAANAALASATLMGTMWGLWGLGGAPFAQNWNDIARAINDIFNDTIFPTTERMARQLDEALGTKGLNQFGLVSMMLGYDVSGSAQGPGFQLPGATARAAKNIFDLVILSGKTAFGSASRQDWWEWSQKQPPLIRGFADQVFRGVPFVRAGDTTAQKHYLEMGQPRTLKDQIVTGVTGMRSIAESAARGTDRLVKDENKQMADRWALLLKKSYETGWTPELLKEMSDMAAEDGKNPGSYINGYVEFQIDKNKTPEQRRLGAGTNLPQVLDYQRFLKEQSREPAR